MRVWRSLLRRKLRTTFAVLGVAIGIAAVVSLVSAAKGFKEQFQKITSYYHSEILVIDKGASSPVFSLIDETELTQVARLPGVRAVTGNILTFCKLPQSPMFLVIGLDPRGGLIEQVTIVRGSTLPRGARGDALLGQRAAESMRLDVGGTLSVREHDFRIVGIYTQGTNISDSGAILPLDEAQEVMNMRGKVSMAAVSLDDLKATDAVLQEITQRFPSLSATRAGDFVSQFKQLEMVDTFAWAISFLAALVGGVGVMNTMMMSVFERTREIGVLRAIGWSGRRVLRMVVVEGTVLSLVGGLFGVLLGVGMLELAVRLMTLKLGWAESTYRPLFFLQVLGLSLVLGVIGSLLPAWKASRLDPIEALRYE